MSEAKRSEQARGLQADRFGNHTAVLVLILEQLEEMAEQQASALARIEEAVKSTPTHWHCVDPAHIKLGEGGLENWTKPQQGLGPVTAVRSVRPRRWTIIIRGLPTVV